MERCVNALKEWTGKAKATIVYDSTVDEFTANEIFNNVKGKPNIAVVGFTTDGDVFGGFYSVAVTEQWKYFKDPTTFIFSFESRGRCETPQQFVPKKWRKDEASVMFCNDRYGFVQVGVFCVGDFWLGDESSDSYCYNLSGGFEGLEDTTMTDQDGTNSRGPYHHCARLVAVLLE